MAERPMRGAANMHREPDVECRRCRWCLIDLSGDPWCSRNSPPVRTVPRGLCPYGRTSVERRERGDGIRRFIGRACADSDKEQ